MLRVTWFTLLKLLIPPPPYVFRKYLKLFWPIYANRMSAVHTLNFAEARLGEPGSVRHLLFGLLVH